ncbi:DUF5801 repeats-in-toxin domain-containing protein [Bradyrhizobium sp. CCBAU 51627]|uniref:DUF5801 repeats-in-toxin domain-containing protein n=1 Tax=Bradyrhizobium sp. CCBAU 51627 TaxID=1325088 RepID=UPI002305407F|nr:DUF5801 repeats-in-toxin domain-containing protein [Bradyrhizobium sp. CCBAU 51627]
MSVTSTATHGDEREAAAARHHQVKTAKSSPLDFPVAPTCERVSTGRFGMLSLTALLFSSTIKEANAADPDVTFLDDDTITYKDLTHGAFELVTKEPIPRHIIVDDPGETIVVKKVGSSVSVNQVTNSAARMEELQAAQQDALANLEGPHGSGTPPFVKSLSLQPISFIPTEAPAPQNPLAPIPPFILPELLIMHLPPTLSTGAGPIERDTIVFDKFTATSGSFSASSSDSDAKLTFGISGGINGNTVLDGVTYDVSQTSPYGTLYLSSGGGAYTFVPNSDAINALKVPTTTNFTISVSDGSLSVDQIFTITLNGVEDAAVISGTTTGSAIAAGGVVNASPGTLIASGTLTDTDPDDPANTFTAVSSATASTYGTFTMTTAGVWTYTLDKANSQVQALHVGDTLTDSFTVTSIDGTPQVITITINGPLIAVTGTAPSLTLSETHLTATSLDDSIAGSAPDATQTTTSGDFSTAFTSVQGANGATISYALSITGGNGTASGLIDSHTGQADVLVLNGNTIEGHVSTVSGTLAFTITLDPTTGLVTFTEFRAVTEPLGTNPDGGEGLSLTAGIVTLSATIIEKDGNFQTASRDLGSRLTITDDGPTIAATGTAPSLTLSETHLTATAQDDNIAGSSPDATLTTTSGNFSTAFTSVPGADGATISYALSVTGGNGTASGLLDSHTGQADVLVQNGNTIEGHVGTVGGPLAFTITLDPTTGIVTFTECRAVTQPFGTNPDGEEGLSLTAGTVNLTATITDRDGDFQTASLDLGTRLTITDDGPEIGGFGLATIVATDNQVLNGTYNVSFGADGESAIRVAIHNGTVNGYDLATTDLGGGITSVHVTGNGDDYTFYYTTKAVSGGVELDAFFTDKSGTLSDPYFRLLINPDGTYTFDIETVGFLQQTTVTGSDFGASGSGQPSLTAPDGLLVISGDFNGVAADVKASSNGIAVGDTGLQMDQHETLNLTFTPMQTDVSFALTQWQGNGTADVVFKVFDGTSDVHDFSINIPKPSGDAHIVVEQTSNLALVNTYTFDSATSTYTLYVGSNFNQIGVSYDHAIAGNATFAVNNISYSEGSRIPSTDLLFDVTAVDRDGDASTTSLPVDLLGSTNVASAVALSAPPQPATTAVNGTNDGAISATTTGSVIEAAGGTPTASGALINTDVNPTNTFTAVPSPSAGDGGYGMFTMTAAGLWTYPLDNNNSLVQALGVGDTQADTFTATNIDGKMQVVTIAIHGAGDAPSDFDNLLAGPVATSDPPLTPVTHGSETLAAGSNMGQIISAGAGNDTVNGTGQADILQGGSDNDAIKGNDGDVTTHGGSGSDAVVGTKGNDTIIGGSVADQLTGGTGNDRFAHLSATDSKAGQFGTVTDFNPGSDRIELTALGALGFVLLALNSASTSVPAHTIAWLHDSAANETIVYVNPTDQSLRIGSSGLLEFHLQGIATIDASDFILPPAAAPVLAAGGEPLDLSATTQSDASTVTITSSSDITLGDGALLAAWSSTDQSSDAAHSVFAAMDQIGWTEFIGLSGSDDAQARTAEIASNDAITFSPGDLSTILQSVAAPTTTSFVFDHLTVPDSADNVAVAGTGQLPGIAFATPGLAHDAAEQGTLTPERGQEARGAPENANNAHAHGGAGNDGADTKPNPSLLKANDDDASHSSSGEATGHHDVLRQAAVAVDPPSAGHAASGPAAADSHALGDSFHFRDGASHGESSRLSAGLDDLSDPSGHQEHAGVVDGSGAEPMPDLSPPHIDPAHGAGSAGAHVPHDLIV